MLDKFDLKMKMNFFLYLAFNSVTKEQKDCGKWWCHDTYFKPYNGKMVLVLF